MALIIEPVKNNEAALLSNISIKTFHDTFHQFNKEEDMEIFLKKFTANEMQRELNEASNYFYFARYNGEVVGYVKLSTAKIPQLPNEEILEICRIYVLKDKLGKGVGKALMELSTGLAKQLGKKTIVLGVWEHNQRAIAFYKSFGFEKFGEHIFMLGRDAQTDWLMKKAVPFSEGAND
jgi:ribosomal protein S18 acetylase RimI-like enzyme